MVTMVYPDQRGMDSRLVNIIRFFERTGQVFIGPRSFTDWHWAVAYALLPADPNITTARRRVHKGSSGRWLVEQTFALSPDDVAVEAADDREARRTGGTFAARYLGPA